MSRCARSISPPTIELTWCCRMRATSCRSRSRFIAGFSARTGPSSSARSIELSTSTQRTRSPSCTRVTHVFTAGDRRWIIEHPTSLAEIEKATMRVVALRMSRHLSEAADRLGMAPEARRRTIELYADLSDPAMAVPYLRIINPPVWELGHVAWFQEHWVPVG